jgi:adenine deaminase
MVVTAEIVKNTPSTKKSVEMLKVVEEIPQLNEDIAYVAVIDRYRGKHIGRGFVKDIKYLSTLLLKLLDTMPITLWL